MADGPRRWDVRWPTISGWPVPFRARKADRWLESRGSQGLEHVKQCVVFICESNCQLLKAIMLWLWIRGMLSAMDTGTELFRGPHHTVRHWSGSDGDKYKILFDSESYAATASIGVATMYGTKRTFTLLQSRCHIFSHTKIDGMASV